MKKIILILFLFLLCFLCYVIYYKTQNNKIYITAIGDNLTKYQYLKNNNKISTYNTYFTNNDLRMNDLLNMLNNNEVDNAELSIHQVLKKTDILIISIGMNDIYYKLKDDTKNIYTFLNNMENTYENILAKISKYSYKQVIVLGYYNITNENNDIFTYINYKMAKATNEYNYTYLNLNKIMYNKPEYLEKVDNIYLNETGFKQISSLIVEKLKKYDII